MRWWKQFVAAWRDEGGAVMGDASAVEQDD